MACVLTTGFTLAQDCRRGKGGVRKFFITELANISSMTTSGGVVTAITMVGGKKFFQYDMRKGAASTKSTFQGEVATGSASYKHNNTLKLAKRETVKRNEIMLIAQNSVVTIELDENGVYWLWGKERGLDLIPGDISMSGTAATDENGYTIVLEGDEMDMEIEVPAALIPALIA